MWCSFSKHLARGNKNARFFTSWAKVIKIFRICFIDSGLVDEPVRPILTPLFKEDSQPLAKIATGGKLTSSEEHVRASYHAVFEGIKEKHEHNLKLAKTGMVKPIRGVGGGVKINKYVPVDDCTEARGMNEPSLKMHTLKRKDEQTTRHVPIPHTLVTDIAQYMKYRRKIMKKKGLIGDKDHGFLFISTKTGEPFKADSWTTYLNKWRKELGVKGALHPHLYRHAFITNKLIEIIQQHEDVTNADDFRKHLLNAETFKLQLREWTGHRLLDSLDTYIHLAFAKIRGYAKAYSAELYYRHR